MNVVMIAFLWGSVIPILFPLAFLGLICHYCKEKVMLYYSYQRPPVFSTKLTKVTL
jgi:hypothetical protein